MVGRGNSNRRKVETRVALIGVSRRTRAAASGRFGAFGKKGRRPIGVDCATFRHATGNVTCSPLCEVHPPLGRLPVRDTEDTHTLKWLHVQDLWPFVFFLLRARSKGQTEYGMPAEHGGDPYASLLDRAWPLWAADNSSVAAVRGFCVARCI
jgi:hypothetical protein